MIKALPLLFLFAFSLLFAQSSKELLRDGLFAEESEGDLKTAAEKYQSLLDGFEKERHIAAVALVRLATVKRKEGDEKAALALYEDFARKFADIEPQATLVKEDYLALSGNPLPTGEGTLSEEEKELARLKKLAVTSPDILKAGEGMNEAVRKGWMRVVEYFLEQGASPDAEDAFEEAVDEGNLELCRILLEAGANPDEPGFGRGGGALRLAVENNYWEITKLLIEKGADPVELSRILQNNSIRELTSEQLKMLVDLGADPNYRSVTFEEQLRRFPALQRAVLWEDHELAVNLLKLGAKVDLEGVKGMRALHLAAAKKDQKMIRILLEAGADPNAGMVYESRVKDRRGLSGDSYNRSDWVWFSNWDDEPLEHPHQARIRPIDLVDSNLIPFLLEHGTEPTVTSLYRALVEGNEKALKALITKGVDLNLQFNSFVNRRFGNGAPWPLDVACDRGQGKMVEILLRNGSRNTKTPWAQMLPLVNDQEWRGHIYGKLSHPDSLLVVMPQFGPEKAEIGVQKIKIETDVLSAVLSTKFPFDPNNGGGLNSVEPKTDHPDLSSMTWTMFRDGGFRELNLETVSSTTFQAGDVIEIVGLGDAFLRQPARFTTTLGERSNHPIPQALLKLRRFPVKLTLEGRTWDLMICPDKTLWDARTKELPEVGVKEFLGLVENIPLNSNRNIVIDRKGIGPVTYGEQDRILSKYPLQAHDHIKILEPDSPKGESNRRSARAQVVEAFSPGIPGSWRWVVYDDPPLTLLQFLADLNPGMEYPRPRGGKWAHEFHGHLSPTRVLPALDLSRITIHRVTEDGETSIAVNLRAKIEEWTKGGKKGEPFDFQLVSGDRIELGWRKEGALGLLGDEVEFFKAALEVSFVVQPSDKPPFKKEVTFVPVEWKDTLGGPIPTGSGEKETSVRGGQLPSLSDPFVSDPFLLQRQGKEYNLGSLSQFWPRDGDLLIQKGKPMIRRGPPRPTVPGSTPGR